MSVSLLYYHEESRYAIDYSIWDHIAASWGFDFLYMVKVSMKGLPNLPKQIYTSLAEAIEKNSDKTFVYLSQRLKAPQGHPVELLHEFKHPEDNVIYVFGSDELGYPHDEMRLGENDKIVAVESDARDKENRGFYSIVVAMAVAYDRSIKKKLGI